jgi:hypothetical protein
MSWWRPSGGRVIAAQNSSNFILSGSRRSQFLDCHKKIGSCYGKVTIRLSQGMKIYKSWLTASTEAKSSSCTRSPRPNKAFKGFEKCRCERILSIVCIELSRLAMHFGSAASLIISMYSQSSIDAWVTPGGNGILNIRFVMRKRETNHWRQLPHILDRDKAPSYEQHAHQHRNPITVRVTSLDWRRRKHYLHHSKSKECWGQSSPHRLLRISHLP